MTTLDCRNQQCPAPVIEARKVMLNSPGEPVTVLVDNDAARDNISRLAATQGYSVEVIDGEGSGSYTLTLSPGSGTPETSTSIPVSGKTVLFVTSDKLGDGDPELGTILLRNFLITLNEATSRPDTILFMNAGVKLVVDGADTIEALNNLACDGVDIAVCGLCLEFYNLQDKLAVGRISNMLEAVETLQNAGRIIKP